MPRSINGPDHQGDKVQVRSVESSGQVFSVSVLRGRGGTQLIIPVQHPLYCQVRSVPVRLGRMALRARVRAGEEGEGVRLELGSAVPWPRGLPATLRVRRTAAGAYHVGPVVAILSAVYRRRRYGPQDGLFRRMLAEGDEMGVLTYVISPGALRGGAVLGYRHDGRRWRPGYFPPPDVLYNRTQATPGTVAVERALRRRFGTRVFNSRIGSKWRQYRVLRRDPALRTHLPATRPLRGPSDLYVMLRRYGGVYVKPSRGGFGRGVWRIERRRPGYDVRRTDAVGRPHKVAVRSVAAAFAAIRRRRRAFIVQQRLHLIRWKGSIADVRVLMQKDAHGEWQMTGAGVRAGKGGTIVSNLSGGGRAVALSDLLREAFPGQTERIERLEEMVQEVAGRVARRLERAARPIGELGIDLAIDRDGRLWFLEANSRTGRSLFHHLDATGLGRLADRRPLEYAAYLAGFRP